MALGGVWAYGGGVKRPQVIDAEFEVKGDGAYRDPRTWGRIKRTKPSWNQRAEGRYGIYVFVIIAMSASAGLRGCVQQLQSAQEEQSSPADPQR